VLQWRRCTIRKLYSLGYLTVPKVGTHTAHLTTFSRTRRTILRCFRIITQNTAQLLLTITARQLLDGDFHWLERIQTQLPRGVARLNQPAARQSRVALNAGIKRERTR
jgi:hypothetical protein